ncbi:MAG: hypothetical protein ACQER2_00415 [Bacillota bacterium]
MDQTLKLLLVIMVLVIVVLTYRVFFHLPTDLLALGELQVNLAIAYLIFFVLLFFQQHKK